MSFESVGSEVQLYEPLRAAVLELQTELEIDIEGEAILEVEG